MRDHFLEVSCGCGESRVISLAVMAKERRIATATLAHIALRITCHGCMTGPDEVHLCATSRGRQAAKFGGEIVWTMPLVTREARPSYHLRRRE